MASAQASLMSPLVGLSSECTETSLEWDTLSLIIFGNR